MAGAPVETHTAHFKSDEEDHVWLQSVGQRNWTVLTADRNITHRRLELAAVCDAGVRLFALRDGNLSGPAMADAITSGLRKLARIARNERPPFLALITA